MMVVYFHTNSIVPVDAPKYNGEAGACCPVPARPGDINALMDIIIDIIVAIIDVAWTFIVPDNPRVTAMTVVMVGDISVAPIMARVLVAVPVTLMFPVVIAIVMVVAVASPLVISTVMFFVPFVMAFALPVHTTCQTYDQHRDHDRKKSSCCFHFTLSLNDEGFPSYQQ